LLSGEFIWAVGPVSGGSFSVHNNKGSFAGSSLAASTGTSSTSPSASPKSDATAQIQGGFLSTLMALGAALML
jgi:hypothetical protein